MNRFTIDTERWRSRLRGVLLGAVVGDALGGADREPAAPPATGQRSTSELDTARATLQAWLATPGGLRHTRYGHETLLVAGLLADLGMAPDQLEAAAPEPAQIAAHLARWLDEARGAGDGSLDILRRIAAGSSWEDALSPVSVEVSGRVGAAARVSSIGAFLHDRPGLLHQLAESAAIATHAGPAGIDGAVCLAQALSLFMSVGLLGAPLHPHFFFRALVARIMVHGSGESLLEPLGAACDAAADGAPVSELRTAIGSGLPAVEAVPAAIGIALRAAGEPAPALGLALLLGGERAAIASMVGALVGAYRGAEALPGALLAAVADDGPAIALARQLADRLLALRLGTA